MVVAMTIALSTLAAGVATGDSTQSAGDVMTSHTDRHTRTQIG